MNTVNRICPQCGKDSPIEARHCPHCGYDAQTGLPVRTGNNLPLVIGKAALPVLASAAGLALRIGWKLLRSRMAQNAAQSALHFGARKTMQAVANAARANQQSVAPTKPAKPAPAPVVPATKNEVAPKSEVLPAQTKRTIRIRSAWLVGDANGVRQQGASEHTIEID